MIGTGLAAHEALRLLMLHGCTTMHDADGRTEPLTELVAITAERAALVFPAIASLRYAVTDDFAIVLETDGLGTLLCRGIR